jgi:hypothetical protein
MQTRLLFFVASGWLLFVGGSSCFAQNSSRIRPMIQPSGVAHPNAQNETEILSANYQVTFSGRSDDKSIGELTLLTCSRQISVSGPLASSPASTVFTVTGTLSEKEDDLILSYGINYSHPITLAPSPNQPQLANTQYQQHNSQGVLRMKVGEAYEVMKAAGVTYTITISNPTKK